MDAKSAWFNVIILTNVLPLLKLKGSANLAKGFLEGNSNKRGVQHLISQKMDESKDVVARVFIALSKNGLRKSRISICDVYSFETPPSVQNQAEWRDLNSLFADVISWLEKEQAIYITRKATNAVGLTCFEGVQLSARGTVIIERNEITTLIEGNPISPRAASVSYDSNGNMQKLGELIGSGLAAFSKTLASP